MGVVMAGRIKKMRERRGLTQKQLGLKIGKSEATVNRYESGAIETINNDTIEAISEALQCSPAYLMGWSDVINSTMKASRDLDMKKYEVVGSVKAGPNGLAYEDPQGYEYFDGRYDPSNHFVLRVFGDSMTGDGIFDGDIVLVEETEEIAHRGQIGVAIVNGEEGTIKHIYKTKNSITLQSSNPSYPPRIFVGQDMNSVRIAGVVIEMKRKFK